MLRKKNTTVDRGSLLQNTKYKAIEHVKHFLEQLQASIKLVFILATYK